MSKTNFSFSGRSNIVGLVITLLLLGALAFVVHQAVFGVPSTFKGDLDARALTLFARELQESLEDQDPQSLGLTNFRPARAVDLLQALSHESSMKGVRFEVLGGATGEQVPIRKWQSIEGVDPSSECLFTCPPNLNDFLRLSSPKAKDDEVFMCYNRHFFDRFPDEGMVILVAGESKAKFVRYADIPDEVDVRKGIALNVTPGFPDFYGKHPFTFVAPE
jgi:hypothetical protein